MVARSRCLASCPLVGFQDTTAARAAVRLGRIVARNYYATVAAPGTLEEMLDFAREKLDVAAPAGDLLYKNAYEILMEHVTEGSVVGKSVVDGVGCDHLAFRTQLVDWQTWIQQGAQPLMRKLVITSRDMLNALQFTVVVKNWDLAPASRAHHLQQGVGKMNGKLNKWVLGFAIGMAAAAFPSALHAWDPGINQPGAVGNTGPARRSVRW